MKILPNHIPVKLEDNEKEYLTHATNTLFTIRNTMKDRGCDTLICTDIESGEVNVSNDDIRAAMDIIKRVSNLCLMTYGNGDYPLNDNDHPRM